MAKRRGSTTRRPSSTSTDAPRALSKAEGERDLTKAPESAASAKSSARSSHPASREENISAAPERARAESGRSAVRRPNDAGQLAKRVGEVARAVSSRLLGPPGEYLFEIKYDGYRILAAKSGDDVRLTTRNGHDWTARFAAIAEAVARLPVREIVVDGEACVVDAEGRPSFASLQRHLSGEGGVGAHAFPAFDVLWLDGRDLRGLAVEERRRLLERVLEGAPPPLSFSRSIEGDLETLLAAARGAGLEGLVAKRKGSPYVAGATTSWIKLKFELRQDCVVCGYTPMSGTNVAGALVLGVYEDDGRFVYAGKVGTGLTDAMRSEFARTLDRGARAQSEREKEGESESGGSGGSGGSRRESARRACPFAVDPRIPDVRWAEPTICVEIGLREWTRDGSPRAPRLLGLREDKDPRECVRESAAGVVDTTHAPRGTRPKAGAPIAPIERAARIAAPRSSTTVPLTNPDKVLFPKDGIHKRDVFDYYGDVAAVMLPHLRGRPIQMQRWPHGIDAEEWFQHDAPPKAPPFVRQLPFDRDPDRAVEKGARQKWRIVVENVETLRYLANLAALTLHQRSAHLPPEPASDEAIERALAMPDYVVIDLDPGEGPFSDLIRVALAVRRLLDALELESLVKTSGKRGLHVMVPLAPGHTHDDALAFAIEVGRAVAKVLPSIATVELRKDRRRGALYVDALQNGRGRTIVCPYSLRALDGAPVSTPLDWSEVHDGLDPSAFNLRTIRRRIDARGDLLAPLLRGKGILPRTR
jgi:bifunctional non-homologous end joining protein LigD